MENAIQTSGIKKCFQAGTKKFYALSDVSIDIPRRALTVLKGRSGSGKTTLLNILGALDTPTDGEVVFLGEKLSEKSSGDLDLMRRYKMGFVFQSAALIPYMSAYENVAFALRLSGYSGDRDARVREILGRVGLLKRMGHMADELSGGERQRVAIARALAHHPAVVFADEPTGALDTAAGLAVVELFKELVEKEDATIVMTTHDPNLMELGDMVYEIADGCAKRVML